MKVNIQVTLREGESMQTRKRSSEYNIYIIAPSSHVNVTQCGPHKNTTPTLQPHNEI